ncbi:MAG: YjbQ family protein [Thermomicrobiaceae bacterium]|nr:YjbQ family protein [Thermomicrobiaceae bacterium]
MIRTVATEVRTHGGDEMIDLTERVRAALEESGCAAGIVTVFVSHSTCAVTISEFEPGLILDIHKSLERIAPSGESYRHNALNADDNAHSHLRSSVVGPSLVVPFADGRLALGTWQRIVLLDFDTHPRTRRVVIQVMGE